MPALFAFHGLNGTTSENSERVPVMEAAADRAAALFIAPAGGTDANGITGWSCSGCAAYASNDDVGFIAPSSWTSASIPRGSPGWATTRALVRPQAVGRAAACRRCGLRGRARRRAPGGSIKRPVASKPMTMILVHGDDDAVFPFDGGLGTRDEIVTSFPERPPRSGAWRAVVPARQ